MTILNFNNDTEIPIKEILDEKQNIMRDYASTLAEIHDSKNISYYDINDEQERSLIKNSVYYDEHWYKRTHQDLRDLEIDFCAHFTRYGWKQGKAPSALFSAQLYLLIYPEVVSLGINPLVHYELYGKSEGKIVLPYAIEVIYNSEYFDHLYYTSRYQSIGKTRVEACFDYVTCGEINRFPSARFNSELYLASYLDVIEAKVPALLHYELHGKAEKRLIGVATPGTYYLDYKNTAPIKFNKKRVCIFAFYNGLGIIGDDTLHLLKEIRKVTDGIILIGDCGINPKELEKLRNLVCYAKFERHLEYDFGSYKRAYLYAEQAGILNEIDEILIANDSIVGPCGDIHEFFNARKRDGDPTFYGITINNYGFRDIHSHGNSLFSPHIQSYFLTLHKSIFNSAYWKEFIYSVKHEKNKIDIIINYEMGMSKLLSKHGHKPVSMYKSKAGLNPVARECMEVLNEALFFKKSMLPGLSPERSGLLNGIFKAKAFPFSFHQKMIKSSDAHKPICETPNRTLKIVDADIINDDIFLFTVSEQTYSAVEMLASCSEDLYLIKSLDNSAIKNQNYTGLINSYKNQNLETYIFKLSKTISRNGLSISFSSLGEPLPIKYIYGDVPCFNFMNHRDLNLYPRIEGRTLHLERKEQSIISIMLSSKYSSADKELYTKILDSIPVAKYNLFSERDSLTSDNAYEFFKYCLPRDENCYYITSREVISRESDLHIRKHLVERGSARHKELLIEARNLFCAFGYPALLHGAFRDIHMVAMRYNLFLMWHGISAGDKNSYDIASFNGNRSEGIFACSQHETKNFHALGHENIIAGGYPRMDKWSNSALLDPDTLVFFFTWRKNLFTADLGIFLNSTYVSHIRDIVQNLTRDCPNLKMYYFIHNSIPHQHVECLAAMLRGINNSIRFINNNDTETFNRLFNTAQHLITDYSSVGYDFSYHKRRKPIFYVPKDFIDGHYSTTALFDKIHPGTKAMEYKTVLKALKSPTAKNKNSKRSEFFYYTDDLNCERAYRTIFESKNAKTQAGYNNSL